MNQSELMAQYNATSVDGVVEPYEIANKKAFDYLYTSTQSCSHSLQAKRATLSACALSLQRTRTVFSSVGALAIASR